jgi:hypothetical protein
MSEVKRLTRTQLTIWGVIIAASVVSGAILVIAKFTGPANDSDSRSVQLSIGVGLILFGISMAFVLLRHQRSTGR